MNIVLLPSPPFEEIGGVSTHVYMLAKGLRELGHHVFIIPEYPPRLFRLPFVRLPEILLQKLSIYYAMRYKHWINDLYYTATALRRTKLKIDVLNIQNVQHITITNVLKRLTGCKTVLTVHGYLTYEAESAKRCQVGDKIHQWLWSMEKEGYPQFDSIVCVGRRGEKYIKQFTNRPIMLIHNGLDTGFYHPGNRSIKLSKGGKLLFAGLLQEAKGIFDALQVIKVLAKEFGRNVSLLVAGKGPQELAAHQYVADHGLADNVVFLGPLSKEQMPDFFRSGDIFLCPSRQAGLSGKAEESFPYSTLEAMSCGLPVVAYRTGGLQEQILEGDTGYLIEPGNMNALTNRVRELLVDAALLKKMGTAARSRCEQNFSHVKMAQQFLTAYAKGNAG